MELPQPDNGYLWKTKANIILMRKDKALSLKSERRLGCLFSLPLDSIVLEILDGEISYGKEIKIGKEKVKLCICRWHYGPCRKSDGSRKKMQKLINELSKVVR